MSDRLEEYKAAVKSIKQSLAKSERIQCISEDLVGSGLKPEHYSDDMYLYRDDDDKFIYLRDNDDDTSGKLELSVLKVIIDNLGKRWVDEDYERKALEDYLNAEVVE